jgi:demethylmenaquinone methyltransferase/2-methoxy-6-polyprenyl-1,4-benzoquinol methylase
VRRLFATIADRYDLITILLSFGRDARWKDRLVDLASPAPGERALDLACGTGDIAFRLAARGCRVCGLDITSRMVELGRARTGSQGRGAAFLVGDMMTLPFEGGAFALVTTGYGLRNVPELEPALGEIRRVLRPGGRLLSLDFNRPEAAPVRLVYLAYLTVVGSALGLALHRDPDTYRYIPESIRRYPGAARVAALLERAGFADVRHVAVLGGLMAIHTARRP